jgi:hypothetical protein
MKIRLIEILRNLLKTRLRRSPVAGMSNARFSDLKDAIISDLNGFSDFSRDYPVEATYLGSRSVSPKVIVDDILAYDPQTAAKFGPDPLFLFSHDRALRVRIRGVDHHGNSFCAIYVSWLPDEFYDYHVYGLGRISNSSTTAKYEVLEPRQRILISPTDWRSRGE